ncbi:hypothetical protein [Comamonas sp.]|nr:hypothetical protein [Comamonas sp.]
MGAQAVNKTASSTDAAGKARARAEDKKDALTETGWHPRACMV